MTQEQKSPESFGLNENKIPNAPTNSSFGQILTSTMDSRGALENIDQFRGRKLINISGGNRKVFLFQELDENQNVVTAVHNEDQDYQQFNGVSVLPIDQIVLSLEGFKIVEIISGKLHNIIRTEDGKLFSFGRSQFGSLGLGGCIFAERPRILRKLQNKNIASIACGAHHTLALSEIGDLFSWGRGFQGQLGLLQSTQTVSSPQFVPHFFKYDNSKDVRMLRKNPIEKIACGSYHSIAIDCKGDIYCWGQARYGQTGTGKKIKQPKPIKLDIQVDGQDRKVQKAVGGFGHTLCLTTLGQVFGWGLNVKGQVGLGDLPEGIENDEKRVKYCKAVLSPKLIDKSQQLTNLPKFKDISCGFSRSFGIDIEGNVWAWGGGCLGFKDKFAERGPALLTQGTDNKKFTKVFANEDALVLFAPLAPSYFKPSLVPSKGGTQMTFFGTGYTDIGVQHAVFRIGQAAQEVKLQFDHKTSTFFCKVPDFDAQKKNIKYPAQCEVLITLDGKKYYPYEKKLLVYSQKLCMESIQPKSGSAHGNTEAKLYMPLHPLIQQYCESITIGFKSNTKSDVENKITDWICTQGIYEQEKITCKFPNIPFFDNQDPFYIVDVSLNGQQFTNHPQTIRFYLISQTSITPNEGNDDEEPEVTITGKGFFDTPFKELSVELQFTSEGQSYICEKKIETTWSKAQKNFKFKMPSLKWLLGDINITEQLLSEARKNPLSVKLNLSKKDPIEVGKYNFIIPPPPPEPEEETNKKDSKKGAKK